MKFFFDLFPVILFFITFKAAESRPQHAAELLAGFLSPLGLSGPIVPDQAPLLLATLVVIVATIVQIIWVRLRHGKVQKVLWISLALVGTLGGLSLILRDPTFFKWKPSVLYWVFALILLVSDRIFGKNLIRAMLANQFKAPDPIWSRLTLLWAGFFVFLGGLNLFVVHNFSTAVWVNFKVFGIMGLLFAFVLGQGLWLARYVEAEPEKTETEVES